MTDAGLRAVVFDFDGTVLDSEGSIHDAWLAAFVEHGASFTHAEWSTLIGSSVDSPGAFSPREHLPRRATAPVDLEATYERVVARHATTIPTDPLPGVVELLDALDAADIPVGLATSSPSWWPGRHLPLLGLEGRFAAVVGRDDVGERAKPAPDVYLEALRRLDVADGERSRCVAIEDTPNGITAAHRAGMRVLAVPGPFTQGRCDAADAVQATLEGATVRDLRALI